MTTKRFDHLEPREYRGVTVEAKVTMPSAAITVLGGPLARPSHPSWSIRVGTTWTMGPPASYDDSEEAVWKEIKWRVDAIFDGHPTSGV